MFCYLHLDRDMEVGKKGDNETRRGLIRKCGKKCGVLVFNPPSPLSLCN